MTRPTYTQSNVAYDYAIDGVPYFSAASADTPYVRETSDWRREQLDTSTEPGEQSLNDWWRRSQASFHLGAGLNFYDPAGEVVAYGRQRTQQYRFQASRGVDVWTPGQVKLLRKCTQGAAITATAQIASYSAGGEEGVLFSDGTAIKKFRASDGNVATVTWGGSTTVYDLAVNGGTYFVSCDAGVYSGALPAGGGTKWYTFPASITRSTFGWVKDRLIVCANEKVYECPVPVASPPAAMPAPLFTHPTSSWKWTGVAAGPDAIYLSGYVGDTSTIYATTLETASAGAAPTLAVPYVVAELPRGEVVLSMISYMGTYVVLGTNLGVRVCLISEGGGLTIGPLSIESDGPVYALAVRRRFVWAGGHFPTGTGTSALYRLDLSTPVDSNALLFPWAPDLESPSGNTVVGLAPIGQSGRTAFLTSNNSLIVEHATDLVTSGWLETGKIRFDTWEDKLFQFLKANDLPGAGTIKASWRGEDATLTDIYTWNTASIRQINVDATDGEPHAHVSFRFTLTQGSATVSPTFTGYQVLGQPSGVRQRNIRLALLCQMREGPVGRRTVERDVWPRVQALEAAERKGAVVVYQDFGTGEQRLVRIDKVQFVSQETPEQRPGRAQPGGVLLVTLVAVD